MSKAPTVLTFEYAGEKHTKEKILEIWYKEAEALAVAKANESALRDIVVKAYLPDGPKEGTQDIPLANNFVLKVQGTVNRNVDVSLIAAVINEFNEAYPQAATTFDDLLKYKPELVKSAYNLLTAEERAIFDKVLIVTPGTPQVKVVQPKRGAPVPVAK